MEWMWRRKCHWKLYQANTWNAPNYERFARANSAKDMLPNLAEDPDENHDLSARFPERVEAMKKRLKSIKDMQ